MRAPLAWFAALLFSQLVHADLFTAQLAYGKGDYEQAFRDYLDLAELGQSVAQYNLAIMYAKGQGVRQSDINAYAWATLAAEGLATTPIDELRDPRRALGLLDKVRTDLGGDPIEFEIRAGAEASSGEFSKAVHSEREAVARAGRLKWDLTPLQDRLARYQSAQPWYGNLLTP